MHIEQRTEAGSTILDVSGRVDAGTAGDLERAVTTAANTGDGSVVLDFGGVEYVSSAGLRVLLLGVKSLSGTGRKLILAAPRADVMDVIALTGFQRILTIAPTIEDALKQSAA